MTRRIAIVLALLLGGCSSPEGQWQCGRAADVCRDVHYYVLSGGWLLEFEDCDE